MVHVETKKHPQVRACRIATIELEIARIFKWGELNSLRRPKPTSRLQNDTLDIHIGTHTLTLKYLYMFIYTHPHHHKCLNTYNIPKGHLHPQTLYLENLNQPILSRSSPLWSHSNFTCTCATLRQCTTRWIVLS